MLLPLLMGILLTAVHYFSEKLHLLRHGHQMTFASFSAGLYLSYLILELLPSLFENGSFPARLSLIFVLIGFSFFHLLEKHIWRHETKNPEDLRRELKEVHSLAFFLYHFILGILLVGILATAGLRAGILFFIPLLLITAVSSLSLKGIHGLVRQKPWVKALLSLSTLLGILTALAFPLSPTAHSTLLGFVVGALLFIVIEDAIPRERKGQPLFFVLGAALYALLIGLTWIV